MPGDASQTEDARPGSSTSPDDHTAVANPLLEVSELGFSYGDRLVLRDIEFSLRPGEIVALLGPNGSGKSTLLRSLLGQLSASGNVTWRGQKLERSSGRRRELARLVAYLSQAQSFDPALRVADVLRLGRAPYLGSFGVESSDDIRIVQETAALLHLTDLFDRPLDQLSGGQRQRVFLGRCIAQEPRALLLDEPNTFLDLRHQVELGQLLRDLARSRGIGVLMASHDLNLASQFADRLLLLAEGTLLADGPPPAVLKSDLLERAYGLPLRVVEIDGRKIVVS